MAAEHDNSGLFGPDSVSWSVLREAPVMIGGLRALLMHAAHPLVIAGADTTRAYALQPWARLQRTLALYLRMIFGTTAEAMAAARTINRRHRHITGVDPETRRRYDARDRDLMLWVHGCLVLGFLHFEQRTVGVLPISGRQRFHQEQMRVAELIGLASHHIPQTVDGLSAYAAGVVDSGVLRLTAGAVRVGQLVRRPPCDTPYRRSIRVAQRLAFASLPAALRELYSVPDGRAGQMCADLACRGLRRGWRSAPPRYRFIAQYRRALARLDPGRDVPAGGLFWDVLD